MKKVNSLLKGSFILFLFPFILGAQKILEKQSGIFLFDQFADGKILLTDKRCIETQFNYNCEKQELFVPSREGASFFECIPVGEDILLVDWKVKLHYKGKRGAMGVVTQSGGQASVDVALMQNKGLSFPTNSVYKKDYQNTYRTCLDGQQVSFSNLKSFLKLYPDTHRKAIRQLVKEQSIHFDDPWQVAKLIVLCQTM